MGKSLIQVVNTSSQAVAVGSVIPLGSAARRYGCNCRLNGNAVEVTGEGSYTIDAAVTVAPTAAGTVQVALYANGVQIPAAISSAAVSTAGSPVTLPIVATIRQGCCCDSADSLALVLVAGAGTVNNVSLRVEKS